MNIERILKRFEEWYKNDRGLRSSSKETKELIKKYQSIPLTLPIIDESMKRVCEVLTRAGYRTHTPLPIEKRFPPHILFECPSQYHIRHLVEILHGESSETNFPWHLTMCTGEVFVNSDDPLVYIMQPEIGYNEIGRIGSRNHQKMVDDLDIIGISVLRYFSSADLKDLEKDRKKRDSIVRKFKIPDVPADFFRK